MAKFTISMDMDGVLYPFDIAFNGLIEKYGGEPHDFKTWINFSEVFGDKIVDKVWNDSDLFLAEEPYPGADYVMNDLNEMKDVKVYLVTNPGRNPHITIPAKWAWVQKHFPWIHPYQFVTTHAKWLFRTDLLVEDHPPNIEKFLKFNPDKTGMLIERPWNERKVAKLMNKGVYIMPRGVTGLATVVKFLVNRTFEEAVNE